MLEEGRSGERERVRAGLLPLGSDSRWGLRPRAGPISKRELADPLGFAASLRDSRRAVSAPPSPPSMSAECLACWQKPLFRSKTLREAAVVASMSSHHRLFLPPLSGLISESLFQWNFHAHSKLL